MSTAEISERGEWSLWPLRLVFTLWDWSFRSLRFLGRGLFPVLSPLWGGSSSPWLTTVGDLHLLTLTRVLRADLLCVHFLTYSGCDFHQRGLLMGFSEGTMAALIVPRGPSATQPEPDGWSRRDLSDWGIQEASRCGFHISHKQEVELITDLQTPSLTSRGRVYRGGL